LEVPAYAAPIAYIPPYLTIESLDLVNYSIKVSACSSLPNI